MNYAIGSTGWPLPFPVVHRAAAAGVASVGLMNRSETTSTRRCGLMGFISTVRDFVVLLFGLSAGTPQRQSGTKWYSSKMETISKL